MVTGEGADENKAAGARAWCGAGSVNRMGPDGRYSLDDYQLRTSSDLLDICTLDPSHSHYWEARGFCIGYFAGAIDLHDALAVSNDVPRLACPSGKVTRNEVVETFVTYAKAHPEHLDERPMDRVPSGDRPMAVRVMIGGREGSEHD